MHKILILLIVFSNISFAKMSDSEIIENQFLHDEWDGPKKLAPLIKKADKNPCEFLMKKMDEHKKTNFAKVRVMKTMTHLKCQDNLKVSKEYLHPKTYFTVQAEAIRMASNLPTKQKKEVVPLINILKRKTKDQYILDTIKEFEGTLKKNSQK